jgi:hypothetical protein
MAEDRRDRILRFVANWTQNNWPKVSWMYNTGQGYEKWMQADLAYYLRNDATIQREVQVWRNNNNYLDYIIKTPDKNGYLVELKCYILNQGGTAWKNFLDADFFKLTNTVSGYGTYSRVGVGLCLDPTVTVAGKDIHQHLITFNDATGQQRQYSIFYRYFG